MAKAGLGRRVQKLEWARRGASRLVLIWVREGDDAGFEGEIARRKQAGLLRPHDTILRVSWRSDAPCPASNELTE
jgi:hypothetical protein